MDEFRNLDSDIEGSAMRWKMVVESEVPEKEAFPEEWKKKSSLQKLCILRCLRPDRMTYAIRCDGAHGTLRSWQEPHSLAMPAAPVF